MNEVNLSYETVYLNDFKELEVKVSLVVFFGSRFGVDRLGRIWWFPLKVTGELEIGQAAWAAELTVQALCDLFAATGDNLAYLEGVTIFKDSATLYLARKARLEAQQIDLGG